MELQLQSSPKRKEPAMEEKLLQLDDLRNILREKFEGELTQVAGKIETVPSSVEELRQKRQQKTRMSDLEKRMGAIESRSTTLGSHAEGEGERGEPSSWMGGWSEENMAASTLEAAKSMVAQLRLDIDFGEVFVPGIRGVRDCPLCGQTGRDGVALARPAISRARQANVLMGDEKPQGPRHLWLNFFNFPRQAQACNPDGEDQKSDAGIRQGERSTASVWFRGK